MEWLEGMEERILKTTIPGPSEVHGSGTGSQEREG